MTAAEREPLAEALRARIGRDGPIAVEEYMRLAVARYYAGADPLGARGDFITAPEISQVFGELIGLWCAATWQEIGAPDPVALVELGPGRGTLMADALRAAATVPAFRRAIRVHLVETSPALRERQRIALAGLDAAWHETLSSVPQGRFLLVANEFFDALPVRQLVRVGTAWRERKVGIDRADGSLRFVVEDGGTDATPEIPPALRGAPDGSILERSPDATALATEIGGRIAAQDGAALIVDYGHGRTAPGETLQAMRRHRRHDVLAEPGEADLTAHVDFAALADSAGRSGARVWGPISQGAFLTRLGIEARAARLIAAAKPDQAFLIRSGCRRLIDPAEMGSLFQVISMTRPDRSAPAGFETAR